MKDIATTCPDNGVWLGKDCFGFCVFRTLGSGVQMTSTVGDRNRVLANGSSKFGFFNSKIR